MDARDALKRGMREIDLRRTGSNNVDIHAIYQSQAPWVKFLTVLDRGDSWEVHEIEESCDVELKPNGTYGSALKIKIEKEGIPEGGLVDICLDKKDPQCRNCNALELDREGFLHVSGERKEPETGELRLYLTKIIQTIFKADGGENEQ